MHVLFPPLLSSHSLKPSPSLRLEYPLGHHRRPHRPCERLPLLPVWCTTRRPPYLAVREVVCGNHGVRDAVWVLCGGIVSFGYDVRATNSGERGEGARFSVGFCN